jgi:hypothetical protein
MCFPSIAHLTLVNVHENGHDKRYKYVGMQCQTHFSSPTSNQLATALLPNLLYSLMCHTIIDYINNPCAFAFHRPPSAHHSCPTHYLSHHHMHVYLTILLQVHIEVWLPLICSTIFLLLLGHPAALPLLHLFLLAIPLPLALPLLQVIYLQQTLPLLLCNSQQTFYGPSSAAVEDNKSGSFRCYCYSYILGNVLSYFWTHWFIWC